MVSRNPDSEIAKLKTLASKPDEQSAAAAALLEPRRRRDTLLAALNVLTQRPYEPAREALLALYRYYAEQGELRDPGCFMRAALLPAWRPLARPDDTPLLLAAVDTYEFLPPDFKEDAILLRAGALVMLNELDETLARFHAARLLIDGYAHEMSGEPALTAVRVLASQDQTVALYSYAMRHGGTLGEVVSECLRNLTFLPVSLVPGLLARHRETDDGIILVGLFDLLLNHREGPLARAFLEEYLREGDNLDAYRYLAMTVIACGDELLIDELLSVARLEQNQERAAVLLEALTLLPDDVEIGALRRRLEAQAHRPRPRNLQ